MSDQTDDALVAPATTEKPKTRQCLTCQCAFHSEWSGERVCKRCKTKSGWRQGRHATGASRSR